MGALASTIVTVANISMQFADATLKDVKATDFGRMPKGIRTNSPAFCFGHLSIYPDNVFEAVGRAALARPDKRFSELFEAGVECVDDPQGKVYPPMEAIVGRFKERHAALLKIVPEISDEVFARVNPNEGMRGFFPTIGVMTDFLLSGHIMMHLGQVSAWRRCMGLGPCM